MNYLLDTNVISEVYKPNCNQNVKSFLNNIERKNMYLSVFTIGELCFGIEKLPTSKKKHELLIWLYSKIPLWFNKRILSINNEIMLKWGNLRALTERTLPIDDSIIAATAINHNMTLVTRNVKDYNDILGISLINPWEFMGN
ncbi:MAG: type II toxin-antitoxin system VapC family toxin [Treponema sp.]|nr:type II toxin-antitoxin system VapC family toxin [Treponema sp.]